MGFEIINVLKKEKGLTNAQIAKMSGVTLSTLDKITSGVNTNPKLDTLQAICRVLGCTLDDFSDQPNKKIPPLSDEAMKLAEDFNSRMDDRGRETVRAVADFEIARNEIQAAKARAALQEQEQMEAAAEIAPKAAAKVIPLFTSAAAAGIASPVLGEDYDDYELKRSDPKNAMFAVRAQGDSMEPHFPDGSIVFCDKTPMKIGDIGVFILDGGSLLKQWCVDNYGNAYLFSLNRKRADADVTVWASSGQTLTCMGRVITRQHFPLP